VFSEIPVQHVDGRQDFDQSFDLPIGETMVVFYSDDFMPHLNIPQIRQKIGEEDEETFTEGNDVTCMRIVDSSSYAFN
jgi:hypothetical protein